VGRGWRGAGGATQHGNGEGVGTARNRALSRRSAWIAVRGVGDRAIGQAQSIYSSVEWDDGKVRRGENKQYFKECKSCRAFRIVLRRCSTV